MELLKIEWLHYFTILAQSQSFSLASQELGISQQVLSYNIQQLENHLGSPLVARSHKGIELTHLGRVLLEKSEPLLEELARLEQNQTRLGPQLSKPRFYMGISVWYPYVMNPFLIDLQMKGNFLLSINCIWDSAELLKQAVLQRKLDMALVCEPVEHPNLCTRFVISSKSVIVASQNTPKPWDQWEYIQLESNLDTLMPWPEDQYPRHIVARASSIAALMMCQYGMGALLIPEISVAEHLKEGTLFVVAEPPVAHRFDCYAVWHKNQKHHTLLDAQFQAWENRFI